ncbi:MAG: hypothetical protein F6K39_18425, partial [Okeania sp. SIO3B3]|nr:hypothetical protein [Okeania sp. SIO3B3]
VTTGVHIRSRKLKAISSSVAFSIILPRCSVFRRSEMTAVSVGLLEGKEFLDLNYTEDVAAEIDFNVVMNDKPALIEVQGTAEAGSFSRTQLNQILDLAEAGIQELFVAQGQVISTSVVSVF